MNDAMAGARTTSPTSSASPCVLAAVAASSDGDAENGLSSLPGGFDKSFLSKPVWGTEHEQKVKKTPLLNSVIPFFARQAVEKQMIDAFNRRGLATLTT